MYIAYLNRPEVRQALHIYRIHNNSKMLIDTPWSECSSQVFNQWPISDTFADTTLLYNEIHTKISSTNSEWSNLFVLIYSGDADGVSIYMCIYVCVCICMCVCIYVFIYRYVPPWVLNTGYIILQIN